MVAYLLLSNSEKIKGVKVRELFLNYECLMFNYECWIMNVGFWIIITQGVKECWNSNDTYSISSKKTAILKGLNINSTERNSRDKC